MRRLQAWLFAISTPARVFYALLVMLVLSVWWARLLSGTEPESRWRYLLLLPWVAAFLDLSEH